MNYTRKKKSLKENNLEGFLFALPWIVGFLLFSLYPIVMSCVYSFTDFSVIKAPKWVGLGNYQSLFADPLFYKSLGNTFIYVVVSVPLSIILALLIAVLLNMKVRGRAVFRSIFYLPSVMPAVASTLIWIWIFNPLHGFLNKFLSLFGIPAINWLGDPHWTITSVVLITLWGIGFAIVVFLAALQDVRKELYEAAEIDGAGAMKRFTRVTIPSIAHVLVYQVLLAVINGFQYFTPVYVIISANAGNITNGVQGGPKDSLLMYPLYLFYNAFAFLKMGRAAAMAWILFLLVSVVTFFLNRSSNKFVDFE